MTIEPTKDDMARLRRAVDQQLGVERPEPVAHDISGMPRFSPDLPTTLEPARRAELAARARQLDPWLQGPFLLGGDLVVGGAWRNDTRWWWTGFGERVPQDLTGARVIDVGSNAGYDAFMFKLRGADYVLGAEPGMFIHQARFLEEIYATGVNFQPLSWQALDPEVQGQFDLVHCHGLLYHELHPAALLQRLRSMLTPTGTLFLGSMMLADPELSEYARFVPGSYFGDATWWWVPGRLALRWMLEAVGLEIHNEFGVHDGPPGEFAVVTGYFECGLMAPSAEATKISPEPEAGAG